jgi:hypothetical protein
MMEGICSSETVPTTATWCHITTVNTSNLTDPIRIFGLEVLIPVVKKIVVKQWAESTLTLASAALCFLVWGTYAFT